MILQWPQRETMPYSFLVSNEADKQIAPALKGHSIALSEQIADGYVESMELSSGIQMIRSEMSFRKETVFTEDYPARKVFQLSFCLEGLCEWNFRDSGQSYQLASTECSLQYGVLRHCDSCFQSGKTYKTLSIALDENRFSSFVDHLTAAHLLCSSDTICTCKFASTPQVRLILQQLLTCPEDRSLRKLYLEGKTLELLSIFCDEIIESKEVRKDVSRDDYQCLHRAKEFIDREYLHPLTIAQVAEAGFLSETKLKHGFKTCFGCTVYEYIVEKRMEMAKELLQTGRYRVKDVVWMVGYSNAGYFSEQFRKRHGINPGDIVGG